MFVNGFLDLMIVLVIYRRVPLPMASLIDALGKPLFTLILKPDLITFV